MREIKFRIGRTGEKVYYGNLNQSESSFEYSPNCFVDLDSSWILMQYTGLKDKNGKEIYEGDVVKEYTCLGYRLKEIKYESIASSKKLKSLGFILNNDCEVVGNIYENPELLRNTEST